MRDAIIITFYKNKGDRLDCNIYRGISVMSIIGKIFARVLLTRLQALVDRIDPEFQCGFRAERSTDMIFTVRQLQKKSPEQGKPPYLAFSDLTKAFDLVSRKGLFQLLEKIGCPPPPPPSSSAWLFPTRKAWGSTPDSFSSFLFKFDGAPSFKPKLSRT